MMTGSVSFLSLSMNTHLGYLAYLFCFYLFIYLFPLFLPQCSKGSIYSVEISTLSNLCIITYSVLSQKNILQ